MKKLLVVLSLTALLSTACSDSEPEVAATDAPTTAAPTTAAPTTEAEATEEPTADGVAIELLEWSVESPTEISAGAVTFVVENGGEFAHEFAIAKGESYESLPQLDNGAVDEEALGSDFIGRTETFDGGNSTEITFDLEPGSYVFMCNIQFGPNSHAKAGQVLSVTVS